MVVRPRKVPQPTKHLHQHLTTLDTGSKNKNDITISTTSESDQSGNKKQLLRQDILPKNVVKESNVVAKNAIPTNIPTGMYISNSLWISQIMVEKMLHLR